MFRGYRFDRSWDWIAAENRFKMKRPLRLTRNVRYAAFPAAGALAVRLLCCIALNGVPWVAEVHA